ncbi:MAG: hypothetical protein HGB19_04345 [Chlorobiales bacterium]|nr:hypothetical protein [Chlorobiales bacterium]
MSYLKRALLICWIVVVSVGCSTNSEEEDISFDSDGQITHTDSNGKIIDEDKNDWRIQKYFQGDVFIDQKPFPNPTANGIVLLTLRYSTVVPEGGVYFMANSVSGLPVQLKADLSPSFGSRAYDLNLTLLASSFSNLKGKQFRIRIYDGPGRLISYGDVEVSN